MDKRAPKRGFTPYKVYLLLILILIYSCNFIDRMIISVLAQPIKEELRLSDLQIGLLAGVAFAFFYSMVTIPIARLAERRNRLGIVSISLVLWSVFTAVGGYAQNFVQLLLSRLAVGVGEAGFLAPAQSLVADEFAPERRATALAILSVGPPLGAMLGGAIGGYFATEYGWRTALILVGLPGLALAALAWLTLREPVRGQFDSPAAQAEPAATLIDVLRTVWTTPTLICITLAGICSNFVGYGLFPFMPSYLMRNFGHSPAEAGMTVGLMVGIGGSIGLLIGGPISEWLGRRDPRYFLAFPALCFLLTTPTLIIALSQTAAAPAIVAFALGDMLRFVWLGPAFASVHNLVSPRTRASTVAIIYFFMTFVGMGLGPAFAGALSDYFASIAYGGNYIMQCLVTGVDSAMCDIASKEGLRRALMVTALGSALGSIPVIAASIRLPRDMAARHQPSMVQA